MMDANDLIARRVAQKIQPGTLGQSWHRAAIVGGALRAGKLWHVLSG